MPSPTQQNLPTRPTIGSATQTRTNNDSSTPTAGLTLRLRGQHDPQERNRPRIRWAEDVVDNEGMGKKSSKVCCIYHKPRPAGESSSESDSSSSSDSDSDSGIDDNGSVRPSRKPAARRDHHRHHHDQDHEDKSADNGREESGNTARKKRSDSNVNAYEKVPKGNSYTTTVVQKP